MNAWSNNCVSIKPITVALVGVGGKLAMSGNM